MKVIHCQLLLILVYVIIVIYYVGYIRGRDIYVYKKYSFIFLKIIDDLIKLFTLEISICFHTVLFYNNMHFITSWLVKTLINKMFIILLYRYSIYVYSTTSISISYYLIITIHCLLFLTFIKQRIVTINIFYLINWKIHNKIDVQICYNL